MLATIANHRGSWIYKVIEASYPELSKASEEALPKPLQRATQVEGVGEGEGERVQDRGSGGKDDKRIEFPSTLDHFVNP